MTHANVKSALLGCIAILLAGCATHEEPAPVARPPLRVATAPDYPPLIFKRGDRLVGVEADLAQRLAMELDRPLAFAELRGRCRIRAATLYQRIAALAAAGHLIKTDDGYRLAG